MEKNKVYRILLDDYSKPGFVSSSKNYYGTLADINGFITSLEEYDKERFKELIDAFKTYLQGNKKVTHNVAYRDEKLLEPVQIFGYFEHTMTNYQWEHINTWGFPYDVKFDKADIEHFWLSVRKKYYRCMRAEIENLVYKNPVDEWSPIGSFVLGYPCMLKREFDKLQNRLAVDEIVFDSKEAMENDMNNFDKSVVFTQFCDEIFGDG